MIDIYGPKEEVELLYRDGTLWVNVDGRCRLRVSSIDPATLKVDIKDNGSVFARIAGSDEFGG